MARDGAGRSGYDDPMKRRPIWRGPRLFVLLVMVLGLGWQGPPIATADANAAAPGIEAADICRGGGAPVDAPMPRCRQWATSTSNS